MTNARPALATTIQEPAVALQKWRRIVLLVLIVISGLGQCRLPLLHESGNSKRTDWRNSAEFQRSTPRCGIAAFLCAGFPGWLGDWSADDITGAGKTTPLDRPSARQARSHAARRTLAR